MERGKHPHFSVFADGAHRSGCEERALLNRLPGPSRIIQLPPGETHQRRQQAGARAHCSLRGYMQKRTCTHTYTHANTYRRAHVHTDTCPRTRAHAHTGSSWVEPWWSWGGYSCGRTTCWFLRRTCLQTRLAMAESRWLRAQGPFLPPPSKRVRGASRRTRASKHPAPPLASPLPSIGCGSRIPASCFFWLRPTPSLFLHWLRK
jgi:hypothetical protein